ncbi:hypothetical protein AGMMS49938_16210 [Fibrobacterales bacterium]|nr:hypothetical protein AGMMS49938_16210 [Fibrobacterales bacterium]
MKKFLVFAVGLFFANTLSASPPESLPGVEITDTQTALENNNAVVKTKNEERKIHKNKGWTAPNLDEQLSVDDEFPGMGQGAIFVPRFSETRLEPEYTAKKIDSLSKENFNREWTGKTGVRLIVPYGTYSVIVGSGGNDKQSKQTIEVNEGKTTVVPQTWGALTINTINEDGENISETYEIFSLSNGESYGKGFGLTQERVGDIKTWFLPPQIYRISRNGENATSILNYITVQVNEGELSHIELVFEESTGRLIAGGVRAMQINISKDSYWTYGLRLGGSASYTTTLTASGEKNNAWNALGDFRLRALYNHTKLFWLTELYSRENMQWLNEEQKESQWSIAQDLLQFQSSVVYHLRDWVGPYIRGNVKTHIFPEYYFAGGADSLVYQANAKGDTIGILGVEKVRTGSPFDPLRIGEGAGLNLQPIFSNSVDISAQTGFAARQTIRRKMFIPIAKTKSVFTKTNDNIYEYGWENSLSVRLSFLRFFTLDLLGEVFFPKANFHDYRIEELSADLRLALTRFLELSYQQQLTDRVAAGMEDIDGVDRFESLNTVQLRLYVNF